MKATKLLLTTMLTLFCLNSVYAQSHNPGPNSNCKFSKGSKNIEKIMCPACNNIAKKETEAKATEDKRRVDVMVAKAKAEQEAFEKARLDKLRQKQEEEEKRKAKEESDRIASETVRKKYEEIANNGISKTITSGKVAAELNTLNLIPFYDDERKIYGFKIDSIELVKLPYGEYKTVSINSLCNSNYYSVSYWNEEFHHSSVMNYLGEIIKVDGITDFTNARIFCSDNVILLKINLSEPELVDDFKGMYSGYYDTKESAVAFLNSTHKAGWGVYLNYYVTSVTRYTIDVNMKILEKKNVYFVGTQGQ